MSAPMRYVQFGIGGESYAIPIQEVSEIIRVQEVTAIPAGRDDMIGVIELRERVVPVISLRKSFGLPDVPPMKQARIVVVRRGMEHIGIIVDCVYKIANVSGITASPERFGRRNGHYLNGMCLTDMGMVALLDVDRLLLHG
ncbi:chemotaxis protein CheW [Paenibacillus sp. NPDC058174]|uniref:chemotaxis protein CheW n=1 Tax=Paenibacillus sp. NPDC058174 TaxID=3346366 RepID=UPI0036DEBFBD